MKRVIAIIVFFLSLCSVVTANSAQTKIPSIPNDAVRLRILANSDGAQDQWLKRQVRNAIVEDIKTWAQKPKTREQARQMIRSHLPAFQQLADEIVRKHGYTYPVRVSFGQVPFPTKLYGDQVYAAGNYEALLVTIGKGVGGNWWCVLFPPLCFVDMGKGEAIPKQNSDAVLSTEIHQKEGVYAKPTESEQDAKAERLQVRFLLLDKMQSLF
jgi:stage II sporulation protein R